MFEILLGNHQYFAHPIKYLIFHSVEENNKEGIRKSELVAWYLDKVQDQIDSEEELLDRKALVEKIIDRLIYHDQIIIPLTTNAIKSAGEEDEDPMLVVHPNYIIE